MSPTSLASFDRPVSARLARRLAAAADGYRTGEVIWFRARYVPDENFSFGISEPIVSKVRPQPDDLADGEGLFGPFQTEVDGPGLTRTPIVEVVLRLAGGEETRFPADRYDALFWSMSSLEKFAIPHYVEFQGLEVAKRLREDFLKPEVYVMAHGPNTEYTMRALDQGKAFLIEI